MEDGTQTTNHTIDNRHHVRRDRWTCSGRPAAPSTTIDHNHSRRWSLVVGVDVYDAAVSSFVRGGDWQSRRRRRSTRRRRPMPPLSWYLVYYNIYTSRINTSLLVLFIIYHMCKHCRFDAVKTTKTMMTNDVKKYFVLYLLSLLLINILVLNSFQN